MLTETKKQRGRFLRGITRTMTERGGFTLIELLTVIVIVLLVSALILTGTQLSMQSYNMITDEANAEVLLSTTVTMLRTEMLTAGDITVSDGKITYCKGGSGIYATIRSGLLAGETSGTDQIFIEEDGVERLLVQNVTATNGLCVQYGGVSLSGGRVTVTNLRVVKSTNGKVMASLDSVVL